MNATAIEGDAADPVSAALHALRISSTVLLCEGYASPWSIAVPGMAELGEMLDTDPRTTAVPFHLVVEGGVSIEPTTASAFSLRSGEAAISFGPGGHRLGCGHAPTSVDLAEVLAAGSEHVGAPGPATTRLVCGVFLLEDFEVNPLLPSLGPWIRCTPDASVRHLLLDEVESRRPGSRYATSRLLEYIVGDAIRSGFERLELPDPGALRGLRDAAIGNAIGRIHQAPEHPWTVERLAGPVGLSPSRFRARFREAVGKGPMVYVAELRLHIASTILRRTDARVSEVATAVGYTSAAGFTRAFKRHLGLAPAEWRRSPTLGPEMGSPTD